MRTLILFLVFATFRLSSMASGQPAWKHFDERTFTEAQSGHKLVLLHLRANWCHWCHVMEEKTYADPQVQKLLDESFITCSEDHDERQDLTSRYFEYGWPATIIFDEQGNELFKEAGYIPVEEFIPLLKRLLANPKPIEQATAQPAAQVNSSEMAASLKILQNRFSGTLDRKLGGFNSMQKSVDFETFEYAFNHRKTDTTLSRWIKTTLKNAAGIYDNSWGGFYQYSTHGDWSHAHYEKLLSVQARYIKMYCWYYTLSDDPAALKKAEGTATYVNRFLSSPGGGYYNAQDADLVKGKKAHDYFALPDQVRVKLGIPAIDSNVYTAENAQLAESFIYLWSATGKDIYLQQAEADIQFLLAHRKNATGGFTHGVGYSATISLKDHIYLAKTLLLLHRATGNKQYADEAHALLQFIQRSFDSGQHYFYTYTGKSALPPTYNISENIELARVFNLYSHVAHDTSFHAAAKKMMQFLLGKKLVEEMSTEPGILSANEEISSEPLSGIYLLYEGQPGDKNLVRELAGVPRFYLKGGTYTSSTLPEDKKVYYESFDKNVALFCTQSYCSSPMFDAAALKKFIKKM